MSATGLDVFDKTLQTTNIWLVVDATQVTFPGAQPSRGSAQTERYAKRCLKTFAT